MTLTELLTMLLSEAPGREDYESAVLGRPRNDDGSFGADADSFPVVEVAADEHGQEINLLCGEPVDDSASVSLRLNAVTAKLRSFRSNCAEWGVYSGSPRQAINKEWGVRFDVPVVGIAVNHSERIVAFLQGPREQWGPAA